MHVNRSVLFEQALQPEGSANKSQKRPTIGAKETY